MIWTCELLALQEMMARDLAEKRLRSMQAGMRRLPPWWVSQWSLECVGVQRLLSHKSEVNILPADGANSRAVQSEP